MNKSDSRQYYNKLFDLDSDDPVKAREALAIALDTRKFEINLYWQRTAYFWALITVAYAGFFAVLSQKEMDDQHFYAFVIACVGFLFSVAWFMVNRGSKFWQENWENHVDVLADRIAGPIYKAVLRRSIKPKSESIREWIIGPDSISVSKVNQWVSVFTICIWICLAWFVLPPFDRSESISYKHFVVVALTAVFTYLLAHQTSSHLDKHEHRLVLKPSYIVGEVETEPFDATYDNRPVIRPEIRPEIRPSEP